MTETRSLAGARVLLGITGGVAAYKTPELVRALGKEGALVSVILTTRALRFVTRDALRSVTKGPVLHGLFETKALGTGPWFEGMPESALGMAHIGMAREADLILVAPATANAIGKLAHGLADDLLSTALIATRSPVLLAPAMNVAMWEHPAVQANLETLRARGIRMVGPEEGSLADGEWGMGRMASLEAIVAACASLVGPVGVRAGEGGNGAPPRDGRPLEGRTIVVTAGGTEEPIDPVRVITNRSTGKMGFAIAAEARDLGARVRLITARVTAEPPAGVERIDAPTAASMADAVLRAVKDADALVMAAAVSDFTPTKPSGTKLPREGSGLKLDLAPTTDILKEVRAAHPGKLLVGFALETEDEINRGRGKMQRKGLDLVAINNPGKPGSAFGSDTNDVTLIDSDGRVEALGLRPKREVARAILLRVAKALNQD
ncbi:MAG TPA: bifunctional phosphopantothenoylcysteine decarboxylase/phosphopantothenate--cysteine ligase CoaBC [Candidatus Eisenbacteria bacterium]|nr:bifunctional phosphopantothenoylcysteine decarboxylase/phosphopantothenate--cysteine ligase CoaBC [Candidatus Eisenbacteria bacterium]